MIKYKAQKYLTEFPVITVFFVFMWIYPLIYFTNYLKTDGAPVFSDKSVFLNIMGPFGNYINVRKIVVLYLILLVFGLYFVFKKDNSGFVVRLKTRHSYVTTHLRDIIIFVLTFVFLLEAVNIACALFTFDFSIIAELNLIPYSAIDFVTLLLFYMRAGVLLFIAGVVANKKAAPFITIAIYLIEFFSATYLPFINFIWLPYKDAISVPYLLAGEITPTDVLPGIIRGVIMNLGLIAAAYWLFLKKDIIYNEKK
jgi:hypothetical protein